MIYTPYWQFLMLGLALLLSACSNTSVVGKTPQAVEIVAKPAGPTATPNPTETATSLPPSPTKISPPTPPPTATIAATATATQFIPTDTPTTAATLTPSPLPETVTPTLTPTVLTGPTEAQGQLLAGLSAIGPAPELFTEVWLNSEPLKLENLRGQVVLVEFWTFGCINCKHVIPSIREWHHTYKDEGLVIIGVHTPEFGYERELENVRQALVDLDVPYPVAIDNDWTTWRAYNNRYWPAQYLIDKTGQIRYIHIGEGRYKETEAVIQALLAEESS